VSDFEYELQMALMNRRLGPGIETVFMMPAEQYTYVSSRLVKEVFALGGPVTGSCPRSSSIGCGKSGPTHNGDRSQRSHHERQ